MRPLISLLAALVSLGPLPAAAGAAATPQPILPPVVEDAGDRAAPPPVYQMKCWQFGRLIIDEPNLQEPAAQIARATVKASGPDASSLYLVETANATCLVKAQRR